MIIEATNIASYQVLSNSDKKEVLQPWRQRVSWQPNVLQRGSPLRFVTAIQDRTYDYKDPDTHPTQTSKPSLIKYTDIWPFVLLTCYPIAWKVLNQSFIHDDPSWWTTDFLVVLEKTFSKEDEVATPIVGEVFMVIILHVFMAGDHEIFYGLRTWGVFDFVRESMWGVSWQKNKGDNNLRH